LSRNNADRLGSGARDLNQGSSPAGSAPLSFSTPTEFVELPTKGRYYPEGHPLHDVGELEIRYMTAKDEDILTSKTLLQKGIAIDRFLRNILVDKTINIDELYVGDKNAILIAARITGYGEEYNFGAPCPVCSAISQQLIDLTNLTTYYGEELDECMQKTDAGTFLIQLPTSNVNLEVRLMRSVDEDYLVKLAENKRKKNLPESSLTDQLTRMIVSVNGDTSSATISRFVDTMPARDSRYLRSNYFKIVPDIDMTFDFSCRTCTHSQEMGVPLTAEFFWPK